MTSDFNGTSDRTARHFVVDAFTDVRFRGNSAAVVVLETYPEDAVMQAMAAENNLAETAFIVRESGDQWRIRWLTPVVEVDLCGHATLASAHVVLRHLDKAAESVTFASRSGPLTVKRAADGARLTMDFPARPPTKLEGVDERIAIALGRAPLEVWRARDLVPVFASADDIRALRPDMSAVCALADFAVNPTAPGGSLGDDGADFVSRFFAPNEGVDEDPVTGSAHCTLAPLWAQKLGKTTMRARQLSERGGVLDVEVSGERVLMTGQAVLVVDGTVHF